MLRLPPQGKEFPGSTLRFEETLGVVPIYLYWAAMLLEVPVTEFLHAFPTMSHVFLFAPFE